MFEGMRRHAPWIIIGIAAVFILSMAIGGTSSIFIKKDYLGIIEGEKITPTKYRELYDNAISNYVQQNPDKEIDEQQLKKINDETWNQLVQKTLFDKELKKRKLKVTEDAIIAKMKNPADDVKQIEQLQTDGEFDYDKYETLLIENPEFANWIEARIRGTFPYEMLYEDVKSEVNLSEEDVRQKYYDENNKASAKIIFFDPKKTDIEVTQEDMDKYYEEHKEDYKKGPARKLKYVKIPLEASEEDKQLAKTKADSIYNIVIDGMDFAEAAETYSEGPSASKGGDLGFFARERMVTEFSDKAFSMGVNEISEPVLSQFGWHIIKVFAKRTGQDGKEEVQASHILIKAEASEKTKSNLEVIANDLYDKAKEVGLDSAAVVMAYDVKETRDFYEDASYISGIGRSEELIEFAFSRNEGDLSKPMIVGENDYFLAQVSHKIGDHYQTLDSQINTIRRKTKDELGLKAVIKEAEEFVTLYDSSKYLEAAEKSDWKIIEAKDIILDKTISGLRKDEELNRQILALEEDQYSDLITNDFGAYLSFVEKKILPDMDKFEEEKDTLIEKANEEAKTEHLNEWYRNLQETAEIEDNRDMYYSF